MFTWILWDGVGSLAFRVLNHVEDLGWFGQSGEEAIVPCLPLECLRKLPIKAKATHQK